MLAYTPLHWLVLHALAGAPDFRSWREAASDLALVATSANLGGEPLVAADEDAERRLAGVADLIVTHERAIVVRADDSVVRVIDGAPAFRGARAVSSPTRSTSGRTAPASSPLAATSRTRSPSPGLEAFVSQHIGDSTIARRSVFATRPSGG